MARGRDAGGTGVEGTFVSTGNQAVDRRVRPARDDQRGVATDPDAPPIVGDADLRAAMRRTQQYLDTLPIGK